ncbi:hypothetical protein NDU88_006309 [Pleurodeles waltl]|uniref:Uncharacterized protein n=1 Tax=Pleurodeles waltl TaxID=8319 RepID=A0AAV7LQH6_PLEWA|nr:hypothetical protein NDU88_006309 [Pleurodeles waltl]
MTTLGRSYLHFQYFFPACAQNVTRELWPKRVVQSQSVSGSCKQKMAEVDFGDSELFEQLDDEPQKPVHIRFDELDDSLEESEGLRERVQQYEATIEDLKAENILSRGTTVLNSR